ncbi:MAG: hypothetical protein M0Q38_06205 [Bacteroidales bacterium]|jgi:hypothetical protein|nr:hypothetical protein [Bacteroidales bacterium]
MKNILKILFLAGMMLHTACSPSARVSRILSRHPELTVTDTLIFRDMIAIPSIEADTVIRFGALKEPVFLRHERLEVELQYNKETLFVKGKCKADTIYRTHRIPVEKIKLIKPNRIDALIARIPWLVMGLIAVSVVIGLMIYRKNRAN